MVGNVGPNKIATGLSRAKSYNPHIYERVMARLSGVQICALEPSQEGPGGALGPPDPVVVSRKKKMEHFGNSFCVEKEFPNVIRKLINPPKAKTISREIRSLRQVFSTKRENGHSDRKISCLVIKKKWKDKVSCFPPKKKRVSDRHLGK